jgi:peroxin-1
LDGVESREGIFIVAASSRPDLIDSAVLRPGRLDKMLNCDFPNKIERIDILKKYYDKSVKIDSDDNYEQEFLDKIRKDVYNTIEDLAEKTEFYTGADLQSLIYNSFLLTAKNNIHNNIDKHPIICKDDLINAFNNFKRSLADKDIKFYNDIKKTYFARTNGNQKSDSINNSDNTFDSIEKKHDSILKDLQEKNMKTTLI